MIFEYLRLTGMSDSSFSLDFIARVLFLVFAGLFLAVAGFKIKGVWAPLLRWLRACLCFFTTRG